MYFSKIVQISIFSLFAATPLRAATVSAVPYTDCSIESGKPCGGMVYSPATWCQNNLAEAIYSTVAGASGSAACRFTASPTRITLGIQSTYHVADVPSCVSSAHAPYTTAAWNITAASNFRTASAASTTAASSPSSLNIQPTSSTAATTTAVASAAPIHTANCTMVFPMNSSRKTSFGSKNFQSPTSVLQLHSHSLPQTFNADSQVDYIEAAGWPQTTTIPSLPTGLIFSMYNSYGRDISPGVGASCTDAPQSCNFASGGYPKSDRFAAFDSELPYPFNWAIANDAGDTVFYYNYHNPLVGSTTNEQGAWDLSARDWSTQQNFTWDCTAPKRVHQLCNATTSYPLDKQDGGDTLYDVTIAILDPRGNTVGGTTLDVHQPSDNRYENHANMQFFSFWTPLITLRIGWDLTDGGGHRAFYFAYGENDYQTKGTGTEDRTTGVATTDTAFDCYYDEMEEPWLGP